MTVPVGIERNDYPGDGVQTAFPYTFQIFADEEVYVLKTNDADGTITPMVLTTDYTVAGANVLAGGNVNTVVPIAVGYTITILSSVPYKQSTQLKNQGRYFAQTVERAFDRIVRMIKQIIETMNRTIQAPTSEVRSSPMVIPGPDERKGTILGFDPTTGEPVAYPTATQIAGVLRQTFAATLNQTLFNLGFLYTPGLNALHVFVNGLKMVTGIDYGETSTSSVTMLFGLALNDRVEIITGQLQGSPSVYDAALVQYTNGIDAVTNVAAQLVKWDVVDSLTQLRAKIAPGNKHAVLVLGFAAAGDGGGGFYWWNNADVTADDGGTIIQLNAGGNGRFNKLF